MNQTHALIEKLRAGDLAAADVLLSANPEAAHGLGDGGESPVLEALYRGHSDIVAQLAMHRDTTLVEAAALGNEDRVRELVATGKDALAERSTDGWTALHLAAFFGRTGTVTALLAAGADIEARSTNYMANTALCAAIAGKTNPATIFALLEAGADPSGRAASGIRPIHLAASRGADAIVRALLDRGARADVTTDDGKTAAQFAIERGHPATAEILEASVR